MLSLEGTWNDTRGNRYTVSVDEPPHGLTVATQRPHGSVRTTEGLIRVEVFPDGTVEICWGERFVLGEVQRHGARGLPGYYSFKDEPLER